MTLTNCSLTTLSASPEMFRKFEEEEQKAVIEVPPDNLKADDAAATRDVTLGASPHDAPFTAPPDGLGARYVSPKEEPPVWVSTVDGLRPSPADWVIGNPASMALEPLPNTVYPSLSNSTNGTNGTNGVQSYNGFKDSGHVGYTGSGGNGMNGNGFNGYSNGNGMNGNGVNGHSNGYGYGGYTVSNGSYNGSNAGNGAALYQTNGGTGSYNGSSEGNGKGIEYSTRTN